MSDIPQLLAAQQYIQQIRGSSAPLDVERALRAPRECLSKQPPSIRDPASITRNDLLDIPSVFYSFACIQLLGPYLSKDTALQTALLDLWPKMWKWVLFLREFDRISPTLTSSALSAPMATIRSLGESGFVMLALQVMLNHVAFGTIMARTAGFCTALSQWWLQEKPDELVEVKAWAECSASLLISRLLQGSVGQQQFLASFGPYAFACAVLERVPKRIIHHGAYLKYLQHFLAMVNNMACCKAFADIEKVFFDADLVPKLTELIRQLDSFHHEDASTRENANKCIAFAFRCISCAIQHSDNVFPWVTRAISRGGLLAVLRDHLGQDSGIDDSVDWNLHNIRPYLAFHSILQCLRSAFDRLEDVDGEIADLGKPSNPSLWKKSQKWKEFVTQFEDNDRARQAFDGAIVELICANPKCETQPGSTEFKRCTGCSSVLYCSRECQSTHWTAHKSNCKRLQKSPRDLALTDGPSSRDQKFLDFLSSWDLERNIPHLQGLFVAHLGAPLHKLYIDVEYSYAPKPHFRVLSVDKSPLTNHSDWNTMTTRAHESQGTLIVTSVRTVFAGLMTDKKDLRKQRITVWKFPDEMRRIRK